MDPVTAWILIIFVGVPLIYLAVRAAWWAVRMALFLVLILIAMAGAAWRGEL